MSFGVIMPKIHRLRIRRPEPHDEPGFILGRCMDFHAGGRLLPEVFQPGGKPAAFASNITEPAGSLSLHNLNPTAALRRALEN
ncbi:hypothetical protein D3C77_601050 [compost metagenome]